MKKVVILGSTGSIGRSALEVIDHLKHDFQIFALAGKTNIELLVNQAKRFCPKVVIAGDTEKCFELEERLNSTRTKVLSGIDGLIEASTQPEVDIVIIAMSGSEAIYPVWAAIEKRKRIAVATKEILVSFGKIIMEKIRHYKSEILPIDSEQVALHQCLNGNKLSEVKRVILTASGGPLLRRKNLNGVRLADALKHPVWKMGKKITIDSATLMNKGLEVIETVRLWGLAPEQVEVLIHPQSLIHSMVEFIDGSVLAQLAFPDMKLPIQYALTYPKRNLSPSKPLDFHKHANLEFIKPDTKRFPCLNLAYQTIHKDNGYPCVLNAANEVAVESFLCRSIKFSQIPKVITKTLKAFQPRKTLNLNQLIAVDKWARSYTTRLIKNNQIAKKRN